jgi:hypothetical protein
MDLPFRIGEGRFCALRASNSALEQTPAPAPVDVTCGFRSTLLHAGTVENGTLGLSAAPLGDVNGDSIHDVIVGGSGRAELFLGRTGAWPGTPDTVFVSAATNVAFSTFGFKVVGLGDINSDGLQDFAITDTTYDVDLSNTRGRLAIFLGRTTWPATVTLTTACAADLCIDHSESISRLSIATAGIGDFDGDTIDDIAVSATGVPAGGNVGQAFIVRGDSYERRACDAGEPLDCRINETCTAGFCALDAGSTFWGLSFELPSGNWINTPSGAPEVGRLRGWVLDGVAGTETNMGRGLAAVGPFDSAPGADVVVAAVGRTTPTPVITSKLFFLSGRAHPGTAGMTTLTLADLGFRDGGGVPSGLPFHATTANTGNIMAATGNVYDVPGAGAPGVRDLLVKRSGDSAFYVYPGDRNFLATDRITVQGASASDLGATLTMGYSAALPPNPAFESPTLLTDFDGDGRSDFAAGTRDVPAGTAGKVYLWYGDALNATNIVAGTISYTAGSAIEPAAGPNTTYRAVEAAGDLNADGHPDLVVGNTLANGFRGEVYLLY